MALRHLELAALERDLAQLLKGGLPADEPEIALARHAIEAANHAVATPGASGEAVAESARALAAARRALDRLREAATAARARRRSWEETLRVPSPADGVADGAGEDGSRRPEVAVLSEIPDEHPEKAAIERAVTVAFAGVRGRWRVTIMVQDNTSWWGLRVEGPSIAWTGTLDGAEEQSPEFVADRVREAVRLGLMQSALGRPRARRGVVQN